MRLATIVAAFSLAAAGTAARAATVSFNFLTTNDKSPPYDWESSPQYGAQVIGNSDGTVTFKFTNEGPIQSSITDIYFDDYDSNPVLLFSKTNPQSPKVGESAGVNFTVDSESKVAPGSLPGGNLADPDFVVTSGMSADADAPVYANGVNNGLGEWVTLTFNLRGTYQFNDVIDYLGLSDGQTTARLRIGIHVQGFVGGGSESFISSPLPPPPVIETVPLPAAAWAGIALFGAIGARSAVKRRREIA